MERGASDAQECDAAGSLPMTARPPLIAEAPDHDLLSDLLQRVRLNGSVFLNGRFSAPFGVISPARFQTDLPLSHLRHASVFHFVAAGACNIEMPDGACADLEQGDLVLVPFSPEHRLWRGAHNGFASAQDIIRDGPVTGVRVIDYGGGGEETRLICGYLESAELMPAPLFRTLPAMLVEKTSGDAVSETLAASAAALVRTLDEDPPPGAPALLGRLMELLFLEVLRRHAHRLPSTEGGVLAASRDPLLTRALAALHREPERDWSVEVLAREAGTSRTVLAERFSATLGKAPMEYLAGWRMQVACDLLSTTQRTLPDVSEAVGYESAAAFSRAFRRIVGVSPGAWRTGAWTL
jgi:AraC-like DNA-binding protein